jgi:hypothetical protein
MKFLQTIITRKPLKIKDLSPGNGGGYPPGNDSTQRMPQGTPALMRQREKDAPCGVRLFLLMPSAEV